MKFMGLMKVIGWPPSASAVHINAELAQSEQGICDAVREVSSEVGSI
jgi:hypothetical protein